VTQLKLIYHANPSTVDFIFETHTILIEKHEIRFFEYNIKVERRYVSNELLYFNELINDYEYKILFYCEQVILSEIKQKIIYFLIF